jgi:hypothetical protein
MRNRKKKNRGDKPIWTKIHIYMEISQGNSLYSYLKQKKSSFFSFIKWEKRRAEQILSWGEGGTNGRRENVGKWCKKVNIVQILCTHVCK